MVPDCWSRRHGRALGLVAKRSTDWQSDRVVEHSGRKTLPALGFLETRNRGGSSLSPAQTTGTASFAVFAASGHNMRQHTPEETSRLSVDQVRRLQGRVVNL